MNNFNHTDTTAQGGTPTPAPGEDRTFSQDDVNRIVGERLAKEKVKTDTALAERESELVQRELMFEGKQLLTEKNLPVELLEILRYTDKKTLEKVISQFEEILPRCRPSKFVGVAPGMGQGGAPPLATPDYRKAMGLLG